MKFSKRVVNASVVVMLLMTMALSAGCGFEAKGEDITDSQIKEAEEQFSKSFFSKQDQEHINECQEVVEKVLKEGTKVFFQNYPVDECFMWWFADSYGADALMNIGNVDIASQEDASAWYSASGATMHALWAEFCSDVSFQTDYLENISFREEATDGQIVMDFIGDVCFAENWCITKTMDASATGVFDTISMDVLNELNSADITLSNNEFAISNGGAPLLGKDYIFCGSKKRASLMEVMGIDITSLANNHVYDHGEEALLDTMEAITDQGVKYIGAGKNLDEAMKAQYFVVGGRKIGFVAGTQIERYSNFTKEATIDTAGVLKTKESTLLCQAIRAAKEECDFVVVAVHWGTEGYVTEESSQAQLADDFVAAGADLIVGSHPHRLEGIEYVDGVPVIYSLGNFLLSDASLYTGIAQICIDEENGLHVKMLPLVQDDCSVYMISDEKELDLYQKYIADASSYLGILENGELVDVRNPIYEKYDFPYRSGKAYETWSGSIDLWGRSIDIVGNLR